MSKSEKEITFTIHNTQLFCNGSLISDNENNYPFSKFDFIEEIGSGANGIAFKVRHKYLNKEQVIKISYSGLEKNLLEAKKNANTKISHIIAPVSDAGILSYPKECCYSIMVSLDNMVPLSKWLEDRNNKFHNEKNKIGELYFIYQAINLTSVFLDTVNEFISLNLTHGDLNRNNILTNQYELPKKTESNIGKIQNNNINLKIIDIGTSQYGDTNPSYGILRDCKFMIENTYKILHPFFNCNKFTIYDIFPIYKEIENMIKSSNKNNQDKQRNDNLLNLRKIILFKLVKYVFLLTILCGFVHNETPLEPQDLVLIETLDSHNDFSFAITDIIDFCELIHANLFMQSMNRVESVFFEKSPMFKVPIVNSTIFWKIFYTTFPNKLTIYI